MELTKVSPAAAVRLAAVRRTNGACERRRPHPVKAPASGPPADGSAAAAAEAADRRQGDYFLRLLGQSRRRIDRKIEEYQKAIAAADATGDTDGAGVFRRMALCEERDRRTVDELIEKLRRRFPRGASG